RDAIDRQGMWDEGGGLFFDRIVTSSGAVVPVKGHSVGSIIPLLAAGGIDEQMISKSVAVRKRFAEYLQRAGIRDPEKLTESGLLRGDPGARRLLLGVVVTYRARRRLRK